LARVNPLRKGQLMVIDAHAHYVPPLILERLREEGPRYGISVVDSPPPICACINFHYGLQCRPFFSRLLESPEERKDAMARQGIDRQVLSGWVDVFGHGLSTDQGTAWHRLLNEQLATVCHQHPSSFSMLASGHMPDAASAAAELTFAVRQLGAVGGVVACNINGVNLGETPLDEYWAAAVELDVPVFLHPTQPAPTSRTQKFALNQVVQYTFDTTLAIGSLIWNGVLDRFPSLQLIVSHGGGAFPYLMGRFDCMHERSHSGLFSDRPPSAYLRRFYYDTILHDAAALRYLRQQVSCDRIVLGTDDPFPPADRDPLGSLALAGFTAEEIQQVAQFNPATLFKL
jgi:aminocarboxymuconate-semialdehyde decarboxylase